MNILVCIKQVPDMESRFKVAASGTWFEESDLAWRINEYDEFAVEQAVKLKEQLGDADLTVLSIGPARVKEALKKALAMGCERAVNIVDPAAAEKDSFQIASSIAAFAKDKSFDVIFTGMQSQDRGSGQVGVLVAELLGIPVLTTAVEFEYTDGSITVRRELEGGLRAAVKASTPALVTCQLGLNTPRYPTLPNIMKAKKKELLEIPIGELLKDEARLTTLALAYPEKKGSALVLEGEIGELVDKVIGILKEKTSVL
ncbi:electron transfer flavoprotein subunit beta/FixA family protein [Geopsychrobacter electrodiphilus]|uniref:electron transfer flavoprotein subunit beta/FixA family protein n=1 Tax=Geopsychrobacter electrodiphilus TaxID=225196 RepID=UPI0003663220|nr:electron transfer flavoprotein subunit beta/FixA family protein [Geopsychrobacter electrodiphilus]